MKKFIAALLTVVLLMSLTAGCGSTGSKEEAAGTADTNTDASQSSSADTSSGSEEAEAPEVHVFNIYSIGEDFKNRVQDFYPGYESTGENSGQISGVPVMWHVYTDAQEYRDVLDEKLGSQIDGSEEGADPDDRIDLFVVEEAFLRDYVESAASMDVVEEVGLLQESLSDQFLYTQQMATDADGKLKAVSWQATPGVFAFRRSIAREVLGTDDPEKVQEFLQNADRVIHHELPQHNCHDGRHHQREDQNDLQDPGCAAGCDHMILLDNDIAVSIFHIIAYDTAGDPVLKSLNP